MINIKNFKNQIKDMAMAANREHAVQVSEVTRSAYIKLHDESHLKCLEKDFKVSTALCRTTKDDYILVVAEREV